MKNLSRGWRVQPQTGAGAIWGSKMGNICYRAVHTKSPWRKVNTHQSLSAAVTGKDGAAGLFAKKVRISYQTHGEPLYVVAWEQGAASGLVIKPDPTAPDGIRQVKVPIDLVLGFERRGRATPNELERCFPTEQPKRQLTRGLI